MQITIDEGYRFSMCYFIHAMRTRGYSPEEIHKLMDVYDKDKYRAAFEKADPDIPSSGYPTEEWEKHCFFTLRVGEDLADTFDAFFQCLGAESETSELLQ